jgi:hypothetical protein
MFCDNDPGASSPGFFVPVVVRSGSHENLFNSRVKLQMYLARFIPFLGRSRRNNKWRGYPLMLVTAAMPADRKSIERTARKTFFMRYLSP